MNDPEVTPAARPMVVRTLAAVGFVALVGAGIWLAVYSTRFVPGVVNRIGAAAVILGSVFTPAEGPSLSVIATTTDATTTISFGGTSEAPAATPETPAPKATALPKTTPGQETTSTIPISGTATTSPLSGLPDLLVHINAIGYLASSSPDSFVATTTVPAGRRPAVNFTIKNVGTNVTGSWRFSATIPTQSSFLFLSEPQQSLAPGDSIDYTLGFDQANRGSGQLISVTANYDHAVGESNTNNNNASARLTIIGG